MVFHSYLDDSKDSSQTKVYVSAGVIGDLDDWSSLRLTWNKRLAADGLSYFKTSEYKMLKGQFEKFRSLPKPDGRKAAEAIRADLLQIVESFSYIKIVGVAVIVADYRKVLLRPETKGIFDSHPYHRALESVFFQTCKIVRRDVPGHNMVSFVHDEQQDSQMLYGLYLDFKKKNRRTAKFLAGFSFQDDKLHPPLQVADIVANDIQTRSIRYLETRKIDQSEFALKNSYLKAGIWNEQYMLSVLKANLIGRKLPVPDDLRDVP